MGHLNTHSLTGKEIQWLWIEIELFGFVPTDQVPLADERNGHDKEVFDSVSSSQPIWKRSGEKITSGQIDKLTTWDKESCWGFASN